MYKPVESHANDLRAHANFPSDDEPAPLSRIPTRHPPPPARTNVTELIITKPTSHVRFSRSNIRPSRFTWIVKLLMNLKSGRTLVSGSCFLICWFMDGNAVGSPSDVTVNPRFDQRLTSAPSASKYHSGDINDRWNEIRKKWINKLREQWSDRTNLERWRRIATGKGLELGHIITSKTIYSTITVR